MTPRIDTRRLVRLAAAAGLVGLLGLELASHAQLAPGKQPVAWTAPLEFTSYDVSAGGAIAYRGDYVRATWDGELFAYDVAPNGTMTERWRGSRGIPSDPNVRKIFTSSGSGTGVAFRWSGASALSTAQRGALGDATVGPLRLDYLRGDRTHELSDTKPYNGSATQFRQRFTSMGAVIHSRPRKVGDTVYVGANDGMLHAFDAATGAERWAYVPSMLIANGSLATLSNPLSTDYPYLVDGSLAVGTVGSATVLVGALGAGAKGLYALNVTSPTPATETAATTMALWEITESTAGFGNLGNVMAPPQLVTLESGQAAVLAPNGLNGGRGVSSLFVIRASDGAKLAELDAGTPFADGSPNGLGGIAAIDRDGNGRIDTVYAGDLKGTVWKFDLRGTDFGAPPVALYAPTGADARPITAAPTVSLHPRGGLLVNAGTGRAYQASDLASTATEYLYGLWDVGTVQTSELANVTLVQTSDVRRSRTTSGTGATYLDGNKGWRLALGTGERLLGGDLLVTSGRFIATTTVTDATGVLDNWLLQVDAVTGKAPLSPYFDLNGDGTLSVDGTADRAPLETSYVVPVGYRLGAGAWSQPVLAKLGPTVDQPYFNSNPNVLFPSYSADFTATPPTTSGIINGHFDFDIFYGCGTSVPTKSCDKKHVHEYDDIYNVVGVNMLNPSLADFDLAKAVTSTSQSFKILLANTRWSPAAVLTVNGVSRRMWQWPVTSEGFLADDSGNALTFTRTTLTQFVFSLPLDAFVGKDWGTGTVRAGLMPNETSCVQANTTPTTAWMKGALAIQIVNATATSANVQASEPADSGGFRLKDNSASRALMLAQYTTFWHSDNKACYGDADWTPTPPAAIDDKPAYIGAPAGTDDPKGDFSSGSLGGGTGTGTGTGGTWSYKYNGVTVTVTTSVDSRGVRLILRDASGAVVLDVRSDFGQVGTAPIQTWQPPRQGRLSWKELIR